MSIPTEIQPDIVSMNHGVWERTVDKIQVKVGKNRWIDVCHIPAVSSAEHEKMIIRNSKIFSKDIRIIRIHTRKEERISILKEIAK